MSELFNTLKEQIKGFAGSVSKKTGEVVDTQKLKSQIRSLEKGNAQDYEELGRMVFEKYSNGEAVSADASALCETIRERTRMGMKERVKSGLWPGGGKIPFGYDYDPEKGILVPNADADTVRTMYRL